MYTPFFLFWNEISQNKLFKVFTELTQTVSEQNFSVYGKLIIVYIKDL